MSELDKKVETTLAPVETNSGEGNLDFSAAATIGKPAGKPDPWYYRLGMGIGLFFSKIFFFLVSILIDIAKVLWLIVKTIVLAVFKLGYFIYKLGVKVHRMWHDMDIWGRLSFFVMGLKQLKHKQWLDGFVFLAIELLFIVFMFVPLAGSPGLDSIIGLFTISETVEDSHLALIFGFLSLFVAIGFAIVYVLSVKGAYDTHVIANQADFRQALEDRQYVIEHPNEYPEDLEHMPKIQIRNLMMRKYGYSRLSARTISQYPFKRLHKRTYKLEATKKAIALWEKVASSVSGFFYRGYDKTRKFVLAHYEWMSPLERYCYYYPQEEEQKYGRQVLIKEGRLDIIRFMHKFDKYNDYLAVKRDLSTLSRTFAQADLLYRAIFGFDPLSIKNGEQKLELNAKLSVRQRVSAVVGAFEITLPLAKRATNVAISEIERLRKEGQALAEEDFRARIVKRFDEISDIYAHKFDEFEETNVTRVINEHDVVIGLLTNPAFLESSYKNGRSAFLATCKVEYGLSKETSIRLYDLYKGVSLKGGDKSVMWARALDNEKRHREFRIANPVHGQPTMSLKRVKEFADEKFAVSVLSLPVLGSVIVTILPLVISIFVAFTNWDQSHTFNRFTWTLDSFNAILNMFNGESAGPQSYSYTFINLLGWTLIWAFFATFTNYFLGIILALIINRKTIKWKKVWRTLFVITIAIPSFISLLVIREILGDDGLVNSWLLKQTWWTESLAPNLGCVTSTGTPTGIPFLGDNRLSGIAYANGAIIPKITIILVNVWVGIPYTMLSTSGILMNIPSDLYESSQIDGAGPTRQLVSITMPYILFVTGPSLITSFVGNINNFNVIFFLTQGTNGRGINPQLVESAKETDLLITWLYELTVGRKDYSVGAVIGLMVFIVCAFFSLVTYGRLGSINNEEAFQ